MQRARDDRGPRGGVGARVDHLADHDLHSAPGEPDPGTGYDVARLLEELIPCCPVVIHTSNGDRGTWMEGALAHAGWPYDRVYPFGDDWIETQWSAVVRQRLRSQGHG